MCELNGRIEFGSKLRAHNSSYGQESLEPVYAELQSPEKASLDSDAIRDLLTLCSTNADCNFSSHVSAANTNNTDDASVPANHSTEPPETNNSSEDIRPYECSFCGKLLPTFLDYFKHRKTHLKEKPFKCPKECGQSFNTEQNLSVHIATYHIGDAEQSGVGLSPTSARLTAAFTCPQCAKSFNRWAKYRCHMNSHLVDETFTCSICQLDFEYLAEFEAHEMEHATGRDVKPSSPHWCKLCSKRFMHVRDLEIHMKKRCPHPVVRNAVATFNRRSVVNRKATENNCCPVCNKTFSRPSQVKRHMVVHTKSKPFKCETCDKEFSQASSLKTHSKIHLASTREDAPNLYKCQLCQRKFVQKSNYSNHLHTSHRDIFGSSEPTDPTGLPRCALCECVFSSRAGLASHMTRLHPENPYHKTRSQFAISSDGRVDPKSAGKASEAPKTILIKNKKFRQIEMPSVDNEAQVSSWGNDAPGFKPVGIPVADDARQTSVDCGENLFILETYSQSDANTANTYSELNQLDDLSCNEVMPVNKPHGANDCINNLDIHLRKVSTSGRVEASICQFCGKEFKKSCDLVRHIRKHTKEKPFECEKCGMKFTTKCSRNKHVKRHEDTQSDNKCTFCDKVLSSAFSLSVHMRTHTNQKPFPCSFCVKSFSTRAIMQKHEKTHDPDHIAKDKRRKSNPVLMNNIPLKDPLLLTDKGVFRTISSASERYLAEWDIQMAEKTFTCLQCPRRFRTAALLKCHQKSHETNLGQFQCSRCQKRFKTTTSLRTHISKHFESRKFKCEICSRRFSAKNRYQWHKRVAHSTTKPFLCPYCGKGFKLMAICRKHILTHRKELASGIDLSEGPGSENIPRPVDDAVAVGDVFTSLRIIPKANADYGTEVVLLDASEFLPPENEDLSYAIQRYNFLHSATLPSESDATNIEESLFAEERGEDFFDTVGDIPEILREVDTCLETGDASGLQNKGEYVYFASTLPPDFPSCSTGDVSGNVDENTIIYSGESLSPEKHGSVLQHAIGLPFSDPSVLSHINSTNSDAPHSSNTVIRSTSFSGENERVKEAMSQYAPIVPRSCPVSSSPHLPSLESLPLRPRSQSKTRPALAQNDTSHGVSCHSYAALAIEYSEATHSSTTDGSQEEGDSYQKEKLQYECGECGKKYETAAQRKAHTVNAHSTEISIGEERPKAKSSKRPKSTKTWCRCPQCGLFFSGAAKLNIHYQAYHVVRPQCLIDELTHSGPPPKFSSPAFTRLTEMESMGVLEKMANTREEEQKNVSISEKVLVKSIGEKCVEVPLRDPSVVYKQQLRETPKPHRCKDCPKSFARLSSLNIHQRVHTDERPYSCSYCLKAFRTQSSYNYHVSSHFRQAALFQCHLCKRQFASASSLSLHMRLHSGATPLKCRWCPMKFSTSYKRQYHIDMCHLPSGVRSRRYKQAMDRNKRREAVKNRIVASASEFFSSEPVIVNQVGYPSTAIPTSVANRDSIVLQPNPRTDDHPVPPLPEATVVPDARVSLDTPRLSAHPVEQTQDDAPQLLLVLPEFFTDPASTGEPASFSLEFPNVHLSWPQQTSNTNYMFQTTTLFTEYPQISTSQDNCHEGGS